MTEPGYLYDIFPAEDRGEVEERGYEVVCETHNSLLVRYRLEPKGACEWTS